MATLHFHGHATFRLTTDDGTALLVDPFFEGNPQADMAAGEVTGVDYVLCTHGHADHFGDVLSICRRTEATLISSYEIVQYAASVGFENAHPMGPGGAYTFPFGRVKATSAIHGGLIMDPDPTGWFCTPVGFLVECGSRNVYFAGDTSLTTDMQLLKGQVDVAVLPIGDNFTMGPEDAAKAVGLIEPSTVVPFHYGTWEIIDRDPQDLVELVGSHARVEVLTPGSSLDL